MIKKKKTFEGNLEQFPRYNIYLNINHLYKGKYTLKIMNKNKVIKRTIFNKK